MSHRTDDPQRKGQKQQQQQQQQQERQQQEDNALSAAPPPVLIPPINFSMVAPGIYRSGYPSRKNFPFLKKMGIRSILCLTPEKYLDNNMEFARENGVRVLQYGIEGNKEPFVHIPEEVVRRAVVQCLNTLNQPVLIHCVEGSMQISLGSGLSRRMDAMFSSPDARVREETCVEHVISWGTAGDETPCHDEPGDMVHANTSHAIRQGVKDCLKLTLEDGKELIVTDDHLLLTCSDCMRSSTQWKKACELQCDNQLGTCPSHTDRVVCSLLECVADDEDVKLDGLNDFTLFDGKWFITRDRDAILAFSRLCGAMKDNIFVVDDKFDEEQIRHDLKMVQDHMTFRDVQHLESGMDVLRDTEEKMHVDPDSMEATHAFVVPSPVLSAMRSLDCAFHDKNAATTTSIYLPSFLFQGNCPRSVKREFLAAWMGRNGFQPGMVNGRLDLRWNLQILTCIDSEIQTLQAMSHIRDMFCDILQTKRTEMKVYVSEYVYYDHGEQMKVAFPGTQQSQALLAFNGARADALRVKITMAPRFPDVDMPLAFTERIGIRYCADKWRWFSAVASYVRHSRITTNHRLSFANYASRIGFDTTSKSIALRVIRTERVGQRPVYDLTVPKLHNFIASGCVVHNCNKGKHRTGVLVGCIRKMQSWSLTSIFDEYRRFAGNKVRLLDQQFIELFDVTQVWPLIHPTRQPQLEASLPSSHSSAAGINGGSGSNSEPPDSTESTPRQTPREHKTITFDKIMTETHDVIIMVEQQPFVPPKWLFT